MGMEGWDDYETSDEMDHSRKFPTWWLIPLSKWVITPVINGISRVNPLITGVITHLLSGMSHQVLSTSKNISADEALGTVSLYR